MTTIENILKKSQQGGTLQIQELEQLLLEEDDQVLEQMAQLARNASLKHFGKTVSLYTPLYLSNYCLNGCRYCNYNLEQDIRRKVLSPSETMEEAQVIQSTGLRHVLLLTGESEKHFDTTQLLQSVETLQPYFDQISVETYALSEEEYRAMADAGVYGVTLYQETYNRARYEMLHPYGPKSDFEYRLNAPGRAAVSGLRQFTMGVLLGISDWKSDVLALIEHARVLQHQFPHLELGFSLPRMISFEGSNFEALGIEPVSDRDFIKAICILRLAMPTVSIGISTRETFAMRMNALPIGINKMSAGVSTEVGGRSKASSADVGAGQFPISDESSVSFLWQALIENGYQPILRDWIKF